MTTVSQHSIDIKMASNRLAGLVLDWFDRESTKGEMTYLEAVYCLQKAQNQIIEMGLKDEQEE